MPARSPRRPIGRDEDGRGREWWLQRQRWFAEGGEAPAELRKHFDEVGPEPLVSDLSVVIEAEGKDERGVD
jgi:hypothetical protein